MSAASRDPYYDWDFTVPPSDDELLAELRRRGVRPGLHLYGTVASESSQPLADEKPKERRRLSFAGSIHAEPDLSERTDDYLQGFGQT